ncbi:putative secretion domain protein [Brucella thiophenivorans]|uniref:Putative secretion domain protein n=2 Tax=Brucella thiophenivorans TaxID=571255 RepID=A0A256FM44_9HYPH|nr:putative secretion domain protein [Brucella thiophenivorans]
MLQGVVEQIFPATGTEFSVLKTGNASGNLIKVVQRLTVKIGLERGQDAVEHIRPGMSVHTSVDTSS